MPISPWAKGQTSPIWTLLLSRDGGQVMDLTGIIASQLSLSIYGPSGALLATGQGTFSIVNAAPGVVRYQPATADSQTIGSNSVRVVVSFGGLLDMSDPIPWQVNP